MENYIKELVSNQEVTLNTVVKYIINTIKAKALYNKGGWSEVNKHIPENERFNHHFSISAYAICRKLRDNKEPINMSIESNMRAFEMEVNKSLNIDAVKYCVDGRNHVLRILL